MLLMFNSILALTKNKGKKKLLTFCVASRSSLQINL